MNRRQLLRSAVAGASLAAGIASGSEASAAPALTPNLAEALEAHRRLWAASQAARAALCMCGDAYDAALQADPIRYVSSVGPMQLGQEGRETRDVFGHVTPAVFQEARTRRMMQGFKGTPSPGGTAFAPETAIAEANAIYRDDLAAMDEARERRRAVYEAHGGLKAELAYDEAWEAEDEAWDAFLAAPVLTLADIQAKVGHILANEDLIARVEGDRDGNAKALLLSIMGRTA